MIRKPINSCNYTSAKIYWDRKQKLMRLSLDFIILSFTSLFHKITHATWSTSTRSRAIYIEKWTKTTRKFLWKFGLMSIPQFGFHKNKKPHFTTIGSNVSFPTHSSSKDPQCLWLALSSYGFFEVKFFCNFLYIAQTYNLFGLNIM